MPPPKTALYKPVPPPKPKSYPQQSQAAVGMNEGNYMNSGPMQQATNGGGHYHEYSTSHSQGGANGQHQQPYAPPVYHNSREETDSNGFDSGQGSSLDREFNGQQQQQRCYANPTDANQYYYNLPPSSPPRKSGEGLDLTGNREYRGSAFELYRKPARLQHPGVEGLHQQL